MGDSAEGELRRMSRVKQIEKELEKLSIDELKEVREWLENFFEDRMEFTPEFETMIRQSEQELNLDAKASQMPHRRRPA
jgi:hypothetical protein